MIPDNISKDNILNALEEIHKEGIPDNRQSEKYLLLHNDFFYPPKYVISLANRSANGKELDSSEFSGGEIANSFLQNRGFRVVNIPPVLPGQKWLIVTSQENWEVCLQNHVWGADENRASQMKKVKQGDEFLIYLKGMKIAGICKVLSDYYYEESHMWNDGVFPHRVRIEPVKVPQTSIDIKKLYDTYFRYKGTPGGYFGQAIRPIPDNEFSIFQSNLVKNMNELIELAYNSDSPPPISETHINEPMIFVTGYDESNLDISKKHQILGWVKNSNFLSDGSIVFVFNRTTLFLDSCFIIKSKSNNIEELIWVDEIQSNKVIYPNRWNAELIKEGLDIPLTRINNISPFDKEPFQGLLRGNFPMPINSPQNKDKYREFYNILHDLIESTVNYWIFIVTDKPSLSAKEIYNTRMNDNFWGLNEGTPNRKNIRKGDKVIFCEGTKQFLGTATIDSDVFQLTNEQKDEVSHGIDFYRAGYGVKLSDVVIWEASKDVKNYLESLSFITDKEKYPIYFQGGVKRITNSEYKIVTQYSPDRKSSPEEVSLWLIRAGDKGQGERIALEKNVIGIGYDGLPGLDSINEFKAFKEHYKQTHPSASPGNVGQVVPQIWSFMYDIRKGDLVILPLKIQNSKLIAVGQIIGDYKYQDLNSELKQFRPIKWFKKDVPRNEFDPDIEGSIDAQGTVRWIGNSSAVKKVKSMLERLGIDTNNMDDVSPYETLESFGYGRSLKQTKSWLSLTEHEIEEITDHVIQAEGKKLEIERSVIQRIISHLIISKHVILVGPPGTGKTDLARRLLRELGRKLLGKAEPLERVASYEWGRYEVIGGISITADSKGDTFHLGCVTQAIKEGKLLLIDEFNRADMNKAFGEMFLALDHGVIQLKEDENPSGFLFKSSNEIEIPSYFRMLCTMNDYDKSLLNELSYGLLRRFAFVEINVPNAKKKVIDIIMERAKVDLKEIDDKVLEYSNSKIETHVDKFAEFLISISEKRQIGISSYIDVIRYVLYRVSITNDDPWDIMNEALIDYILPQFDRLDFDTLDYAHKSALQVFRNENGTISKVQPFLNVLHDKVKTLQNLNKLFTTEEST